MLFKNLPRGIVAVFAFVVFVLLVSIWHYRYDFEWWYKISKEFEFLGKNAQGYPEYRHVKSGIVMVRLPGGRFVMGLEGGDEGWLHAHEVELSPFFMAKYEVSQKEWMRVMGSNPSEHRGADLPVEMVSWHDARAFCDKVGLSLPTEAQWEFACRAGTTSPFYFGGETDFTPELGNFGGNLDGEMKGTVSVTSLRPNGFGLHNMYGNVQELCEDVFFYAFYTLPEAVERDPVCIRDPIGRSALRVMRGGSINYKGVVSADSATRGEVSPDDRLMFLGFRPAWNFVPMRRVPDFE